NQPQRSPLAVLRSTLKNLEAEPEETEQIADLKRILIDRIAEIEKKTCRRAQKRRDSCTLLAL
ncbi:MAG: hypothetical protein RB191_03740, partial [Terriglobia bacterium]|nr:hypothetical protein [Terriglobia bacterium]